MVLHDFSQAFPFTFRHNGEAHGEPQGAMTEEQNQAIDEAASAIRCAVRKRQEAARALNAATQSYAIAAQEVTCTRLRYQAACDQLTET